jgi:hypothetical protein
VSAFLVRAIVVHFGNAAYSTPAVTEQGARIDDGQRAADGAVDVAGIAAAPALLGS